MLIFLNLVVGALLFSGAFWLSIKILDNHNDANTIGTALVIGTLVSMVGAVVGPLYGMIPLLALIYILLGHYDMGFIRTALVIIVSGGILQAAWWVIGSVVST